MLSHVQTSSLIFVSGDPELDFSGHTYIAERPLTSSLLCRLHSSPELRDHLALKRRAALRRHRRLQTLRHLGRLLLLVGIIASSGVALYQQPDLPKSALQALKACLPFHHYTGRPLLLCSGCVKHQFSRIRKLLSVETDAAQNVKHTSL